MYSANRTHKYICSATAGKPKRAIAAALILAVVVATLAASTVIFLHAGHGCASDLCPICPFALNQQKLLEQLCKAVVIAVAVFGVAVLPLFSRAVLRESRPAPPTLVAESVRLNN